MRLEMVQDCDASEGSHAHPGIVVVGRKCKHSNKEEQQQLQRGGDAVVQEVGDPPKDPPCYDDGIYNRAQARLREHYIC